MEAPVKSESRLRKISYKCTRSYFFSLFRFLLGKECIRQNSASRLVAGQYKLRPFSSFLHRSRGFKF